MEVLRETEHGGAGGGENVTPGGQGCVLFSSIEAVIEEDWNADRAVTSVLH
jgi:hypothetical protein